MDNYFCLRCGYNSSDKSNFRRHIHKKTICKPTIRDITRFAIEELYFCKDNRKKEVYEQYSELLGDDIKYCLFHLDPNSTFKDNINWLSNEQILNNIEDIPNTLDNIYITNDIDKKSTEKKTYSCLFCKKEFTEKNNMYRHQKNRCNKHPTLSLPTGVDIDKYILELKKKRKEEFSNSISGSIPLVPMGTTYNTNSNNHAGRDVNINNTTNNNKTNIHFNIYNEENLDYITIQKGNDLNRMATKQPFRLIPYLFTKAFLNIDHPENRTLKLENDRQDIVMIRTGINPEKWDYANKDEVIEDKTDQVVDAIHNSNIDYESDSEFAQIFDDVQEKRKNNSNYIKNKKAINNALIMDQMRRKKTNKKNIST